MTKDGMMIYTELPVPGESIWVATRTLILHYTCTVRFIITGRGRG